MERPPAKRVRDLVARVTKSRAKRVLQVLLGLGLLAALVYFVDVKQTAALLWSANYLYFAVALLVTVGRLFTL